MTDGPSNPSANEVERMQGDLRQTEVSLKATFSEHKDRAIFVHQHPRQAFNTLSTAELYLRRCGELGVDPDADVKRHIRFLADAFAGSLINGVGQLMLVLEGDDMKDTRSVLIGHLTALIKRIAKMDKDDDDGPASEPPAPAPVPVLV